MLLNSVIILLREVLELSLMISVVIAYINQLQLAAKWVISACVAGLVGAAIYGSSMSVISMLFDGVGQEVINAMMHIVVFIGLCLFTRKALQASTQGLIFLYMMLIVFFILMREGSEIFVYLQGALSVQEYVGSVSFGSLIGMALGMSVGVIFYYLLISLPVNYGVKAGYLILLLQAGSTVLQSIQLLMQADWLSQTYPIWDSSHLVDERSVTGQLLYALMGYEATPTSKEIVFYLSSLLVFLMVTLAKQNKESKHHD